jgi:hypothetical protein
MSRVRPRLRRNSAVVEGTPIMGGFALVATLALILVPTLVNATSSKSHSPSEAGCPIFPASNPLNQDISHAPVDPNSANYIASIGAGDHLHPDFGSDPRYGMSYAVVSAHQPKVRIRFTEFGAQSDHGGYPIPDNAPVQSAGEAVDRHVLVLQAGSCKLYELYRASRSGGGWQAGAGAIFNLRSNALRPAGWTSADAAGLPIFPLIARYPEVQAGRIDHALRVTVDASQRGYILPARHFGSGSSNPNDPPMGLRLRLKASFSLSAFHGQALVLLTAMKRYGLIVADNGSPWNLSGAPDPRWHNQDLAQLDRVPGSAFEAVTTGVIHHRS